MRDLFAAVGEIVEQRHTVGFGPEADHSGFSEGLVIPFERGLAIEVHFEVAALKLHTQCVPFVGSHFPLDSFLPVPCP